MNLQDEIKALKERIVELEELAKEEQEFKQRIDEPDEQQAEEEQEFPLYKEDYWYVDSDTEVTKMVWYGDEFDKGRLSIDNVSKTKEQAEFAVEKLKVEAELRKFSTRYKSWKANYTIGLDNFYEELAIESSGLTKLQGVIYFESVEKTRQAIDEVGKNRIKKYIFGVEE